MSRNRNRYPAPPRGLASALSRLGVAARGGSISRLAVRSTGIVALSIAVGFLFNAVRPQGVVLETHQPKTSCGDSGSDTPVVVMSPGEAAELCHGAGVVVADARQAAAYQEGHVAGAIHLPCTARAHAADRLVATFSDNDVVIVYGDSTAAGLEVAQSLQARSGRASLRFMVVEGGFAAWRNSGFACASGACNACKEVANHASSHL